MDQQKRRALLDWVNSLGVGGCVEDLSQLKDITIMCAIVRLMDTDFSLADDADEKDRLDHIVSILEDRFKTSLPDKVNLTAALEGHEFEIAKLCLLLMVTSLFSTNVEVFVERAVRLDPVVQFEIKEMVESVVPVDDTKQEGLNCSFFQVLSKSLSLSGQQVADPQMSSTPQCGGAGVAAPNQFSTPSHNSTPGRMLNNRGTPSVFSTSIQGANTSILSRFMSPRQGTAAFTPMSPIHQLVHSPVISNKIAMQQKEQQIRKLKRELNEEQHYRMEAETELRLEKVNLEKTQQKVASLEKQLRKYRRETLTLEEDVGRMQGVIQKNQTLEMEILRKHNMSTENKELKESTKHLERENTDMYGEVDTLRRQVLQLQKYKETSASLEDSLSGLQAAFAEVKEALSGREAQVSRLEEENCVLREDLLKLQEVYREKCEELRRRNEASLTLSGVGECLGDVVEIRYQEDISALQAEVEKHVHQQEALGKHLATMEKRNEELTTELTSTKMETDQLKFDLSGVKEHMATLCADLETQSQQFSQKEQELLQVQTYCQKLESELSVTQERGQSVEAELTTTRQDCGRLAQSLQREKDKAATTEGKLQKLEGIRERLNAELERKQGTVEELEECKQRLDGSLSALNSELDARCGELASLKESWGELQRQQEQTAEQLKETTARLESVEYDKNHLESEIFELQEDMRGVESRASMWQNMAEGFETQCKELEQKMKISSEIWEQKQKAMEKQGGVVQESLESTQVELASNKEAVDRLRRELEEVQGRAATRERELNGMLEAQEAESRQTEAQVKQWEERSGQQEAQVKHWEERSGQQEALINQQQQAGSQLEGEVGRLRGQIEATEQRYRGLVEAAEAQCQQLQRELREEEERAERELREKQGQIEQVEQARQDLNKQVEQHRQEEETLRGQVADLMGKVEQLQGEVGEAQARHGALEHEVSEAQAKHDTLDLEVSEQREKVQHAERATEETKSKLREAEQDVYIWQDKYSQLDSTHFSLDQRWGKLSGEKREMEERCDKVTEERRELQDRCDKVTEERRELQDRCDKVTEERRELQDRCDKVTEERRELKDRCEKQMAELQDKQGQLVTLTDKLTTIQAELDQVRAARQKEVTGSKTTMDTMRSEQDKIIGALQEEISNLKAQNYQLGEELEALKQAMNALKSEHQLEVQRLQEGISQVEGSKCELQQEVKDLSEKNGNLSEKCVCLTSELEELGVERERLVKEADGYRQQVENVRTELEGQLHTERSTLNTTVSGLQKQLDSERLCLSKQVSDLQKQLDSERFTFNTTVSDLQKQLDSDRLSLSTQVSDMQKQLDSERSSLSTQVSDLQKELEAAVSGRESERRNAEEKVRGLELSIIEGQRTLQDTEEQCRQDLDMYEVRYKESEERAGLLKQKVAILTERLQALDGESQGREGQLSQRLTDAEVRVCGLQEQCGELQASRTSLQQELHKVHSASEEMQAYAESLRAQNTEFRSRVEEAETEVEALQAQNSELTSRLQEVEAEVEHARQGEKKWQEEARQHEMKCAEAQAEVYLNGEKSQGKMAHIEAQMKAARDRNAQLQATVDSFTEKFAALETELRDNKQSYEQQEEVKAELERNHGSLLSELNVYKDKLASMDTHFEEYCQKVCKMEEAMRACHSENSKLKEATYRQESELEARDQALRREQARCEDLERENGDAEGVIAKLEEKVAGYEDKLHGLENTLNTTQLQTSHIEESFKLDLQNAHQKNSDLQRRFDQAESVMSEVKRELLALQVRLQQQDSELTSTQASNKDLTTRLNTANIENKKWIEKWNQVQTLTEGCQDRASTLEGKLATSRKEVEGLESLLEAAESRANKLEEDLRSKGAEVSGIAERTLQEVRECNKREQQLEVALETSQNRNDELEEQVGQLEARYREEVARAGEDTDKYRASYKEIVTKYNTVKEKRQKEYQMIEELQKREEQFREVIDKYKTQQEVKNRDILGLKKELNQKSSLCADLEQKYQERDVEFGALRQQLAEYEQIHKTQSHDIKSLETQLDYASRQLRAGGHVTGGEMAATRRTVSARELSSVKASVTSEDDAEGRMINDAPSHQMSDFKTPSQPNLRKYPSNFSLASRHSSPTGSVYSLDREGPSTRSRAKLASQLTTSTTSTSLAPLRSADVPRGMGALLSSEDEPDLFEFNQFGRLSELQRRNTLCLPHMKSSYPVETQTRGQTSLSDDRLKTGSTLEQMMEEVGAEEPAQVERRMTRKRSSMDRLELDDSLEGNKKKARASDEGIVKLLTPGVKLYKRYSPRLAERRKMTPNSRRFETQTLHSALEDAITSKGFNKGSPLRSSRRSAKSNTPRKTPSSLRKIRSWTSRRKESSTSDENEASKTRLSSVRESTSFQIGFSPVKNKSRLRSLMSSSKKVDQNQVKKKPLKDINAVV